MADARDSGDCLTVDQLGRTVGMSARNIRAYQARQLLAPPTRIGRKAYYDAGHVRRLKEIQVLQRQGCNLASIANILGVAQRLAGSDQLTAEVEQSLATHPLLAHTFSRHGVVSRGKDGRIRMMRPLALRAALDLRQVGMQPNPSLQLLSETLDRLMPMADELIRVAGRRALLGIPDRGKIDELTVAALAERLAALLTEAFRVAIENQGHFWDLELTGKSAGRGPAGHDLPVPDLGKISESDPSLTEVVAGRRGTRRHDDASPITIGQLAEFLYRVQHACAVRDSDDGPAGRHPYPAGGQLRELAIYPLVTRCAGLDAGLYRYDSVAHRLIAMAPVPDAAERVLRHAGDAAMAPAPQVLLVITARAQRMPWKYEGTGYELALKNSGVLTGLMYLVATAMGLAPSALGSGDSAAFALLSGIDPLVEPFIADFAIGSRAAS
ncbi:MAG TPA: SagB family peptide dehydrogenase [Trebonia sp.]|jgi:SagB-type dehydrogenase family enzyme|nr:SagB family peptide dehydrogenase [Trebonia sp.]